MGILEVYPFTFWLRDFTLEILMQHLWLSQGCVQMLQTDVENTAQNIQNVYLTNIWLFTVIQYF